MSKTSLFGPPTRIDPSRPTKVQELFGTPAWQPQRHRWVPGETLKDIFRLVPEAEDMDILGACLRMGIDIEKANALCTLTITANPQLSFRINVECVGAVIIERWRRVGSITCWTVCTSRKDRITQRQCLSTLEAVQETLCQLQALLAD